MRDVKMIAFKLYFMLNPRTNRTKELANWDLWGPLVFCLTLAL